ncbi:hypothetical protein [Streptomyces sp. NPDC048516]|uniref:hypothetical protein n=1 Tax=Streptomyces sp. NPDC048516 TaxID=3365565 RepID=UPI00371510E0
MARVNFVMAGACGLLLAAGGIAPTLAWAGSSGDGVSNSDTVARFDARFNCGHRSRLCINGPVLSGNPGRSQNVHVSGSNSNSGSPKTSQGNTNDDSGGTTGAAKKSSNNQQAIGSYGTQKL